MNLAVCFVYCGVNYNYFALRCLNWFGLNGIEWLPSKQMKMII